MSPADQLTVIDEELARVGVSRPELAIGNWAIPAIARHGTRRAAQPGSPSRRCAATSPGASCSASPKPGLTWPRCALGLLPSPEGWSITGQKVWTSLAHQADWAICLARTDPAVPKHKGITYFLVPMRADGIEIRPLREMTGRQMFNEVFLDDVFVPDDCVVGQPGDGWKIARTTLATERVAMVGGAEPSKDVEDLLSAAKACGPLLDPVVLDQLGARVAEDSPCPCWTTGWPKRPPVRPSPVPSQPPARVRPSASSSGVAHRQAVAETALTLHVEQSAATDGDAADAVAGFLLTRCLSIAGGTTQILLNLVAERVLGLPREETR